MKKQEQPSIKTGIMIIVLTIGIFASALSYNTEDKITGSIVKITGMPTYTNQFRIWDSNNYLTTFRYSGETGWEYQQTGSTRSTEWIHSDEQPTAITNWGLIESWVPEEIYTPTGRQTGYTQTNMVGIYTYVPEGSYYDSMGLRVMPDFSMWMDEDGNPTSVMADAERSQNAPAFQSDVKNDKSPPPPVLSHWTDKYNLPPTTSQHKETPEPEPDEPDDKQETQQVDPCAGITCTDITKPCPDGYQATCLPECDSSTGICGTCEPNCAGHEVEEEIPVVHTAGNYHYIMKTEDGKIKIIQTDVKGIKLEDGQTITFEGISNQALIENGWKKDGPEERWNSFVSALIQKKIERLTNDNYNEETKGIWVIGNEHYVVDGILKKTIVYSPKNQNRYTEYLADGSRLVFKGTDIIIMGQDGGPQPNQKNVLTTTEYDDQSNMVSRITQNKDGTKITTKWELSPKGDGTVSSRTMIYDDGKGGTITITELENNIFETNDGKFYDSSGHELIKENGNWKRKSWFKRNKLIGKIISKSDEHHETRAGWWTSAGSGIEKYIDLTSGFSFIGILYTEPDFVYYDEKLMHWLGGTEGWSAEVCKKSILDDAYGLEDGYAFSLSVVGASAHIEGEKIPIMNYSDPNPTQFYYYKISFEVNPGSRVTGCDLNFETYLEDNGNYIPLMTDDSGSVYTWDLKRGKGSVSYTGLNMRFFPSKKEYIKACIKFNSIIPRTGRTCLIGINEGDYLCNKITLGAEQEFNTELHGLGSYAAWLFGGGEGTESTTGAGTTPDQEEAKLNPKI